ncbi:MAG: helix-turn-helix transcriptional regulator [Mollicutes bacterium]|nr:helix-turn-helix transcriptional regulator [Mollicutes bacterium]
MDRLASNLKKLRELKGISQYKLAEELNIKRSAYGNYETGMSYPEFYTLKKIASYYQMDVRDLLGVDLEFEKNLNVEKEAKELIENIKEYYYRKYRKILSDEEFKKIIDYLLKNLL